MEFKDNINNNQQFTTNEFGNEFTGEEYPSMDIVNANSDNSVPMAQNGMNNEGNFGNQVGTDFVFIEKDFNFDK